MTDIIAEDPKAPEVFEATVHHKIVIVCQRIHVDLLHINQLMDLYNRSVDAKANA